MDCDAFGLPEGGSPIDDSDCRLRLQIKKQIIAEDNGCEWRSKRRFEVAARVRDRAKENHFS